MKVYHVGQSGGKPLQISLISETNSGLIKAGGQPLLARGDIANFISFKQYGQNNILN